jgi:hypothetical protein
LASRLALLDYAEIFFNRRQHDVRVRALYVRQRQEAFREFAQFFTALELRNYRGVR